MGIFKSLMQDSDRNKVSEETVEDKKSEITIPEGISFTDANGSKVVISTLNDVLMLTKLERKVDSYEKSTIFLQKEYLPILGNIFLNFYETGNINKILNKLKD